MTLSWDLFVIMFFGLLAGVSTILGRSKALSILMGSYVGYVVATELGSFVFDYAKGYSHTANFSLFIIKVALFFATIIILNAKTELGGKSGDESSMVINIIFGFLAAGFMTTAVLSFMKASEKTKFLSNSNLLVQIDHFKLVWIVAPIVFLFVADFIKGRISK